VRERRQNGCGSVNGGGSERTKAPERNGMRTINESIGMYNEKKKKTLSVKVKLTKEEEDRNSAMQ